MAAVNRLRELESEMPALRQQLQAAQREAADANLLAGHLADDVRDLQERTEALEQLVLKLLGFPCRGDEDDEQAVADAASEGAQAADPEGESPSPGENLGTPAVPVPTPSAQQQPIMSRHTRTPPADVASDIAAQQRHPSKSRTPTPLPADATSGRPCVPMAIGARQRKLPVSPHDDGGHRAVRPRVQMQPPARSPSPRKVWSLRIGDLEGGRPLQELTQIVEAFLEPWRDNVQRLRVYAHKSELGHACALVDFSALRAAEQAHMAARNHWHKQTDGNFRRWHCKWTP